MQPAGWAGSRLSFQNAAKPQARTHEPADRSSADPRRFRHNPNQSSREFRDAWDLKRSFARRLDCASCRRSIFVLEYSRCIDELHRDWRRDVEGLATLLGDHIPDYRNLMTSYAALSGPIPQAR